MKLSGNKIKAFWFGITPEMGKKERRLMVLFSMGYWFYIPGMLVTWRNYDFDLNKKVSIITLVIQITWMVFFAILIKRERHKRLQK